MGRFIKEQMTREGVALDGIATDRERLTALVLLSVENDKSFPLIFYRDNCADSALCEDDIDPAYLASAGAILVTGTHFAKANTSAAQRKAIRIAKEINPQSTPYNRPVSELKVTYLIFPGTAETPFGPPEEVV